MLTWQFWMNFAVQLGIAVGTILAVVVALFGGWLRARLIPPKLTLKLKNDRGVKTPTIVTSPDGRTSESSSRWYHVRVENDRRWSTAAQVQVFLLRVEEPDAAGQDQVVWLGEIPMQWRHQRIHPLARAIGYSADCDLCSLGQDGQFALQPVLSPLDLKHQRSRAFSMTVTLQARGLEVDSKFLRLKIAWDGQWSDDDNQMARHLVIKEDRS